MVRPGALIVTAVVVAAPLLSVWTADALTPTQAEARSLRGFIAGRFGSVQKFMIPARNEDLPQPRLSNGQIDPRFRITDAKRYLGKLLFFDPVRAGDVHPEFGGVPSLARTASCGSCHIGAAASKAGQVINIATGGEGFGYAGPDGRFVARRQVLPGLVDLIPTPLEKTDGAGHVILSGRFDAVDSVPRLSPTIVGFAFNNRLMLGGVAGEPYDPADPAKANKNPDNLPAGESAAQIANRNHRMAETQAHALQAVPVYRALFQAAFPEENARSQASGNLDDLINNDTIQRALAAFMRTVISRNTPWDRFLAGDDDALTARQLRGARLFVTAGEDGGAGCTTCHSGPALNKAFGDEAGQGVASNFHNIGIGDHPLQELARTALDDPNRHDNGRAEATGNEVDAFRFRTPALRQLRDAGQFMHAGVFHSVRDVVQYYNAGIPLDAAATSAGTISMAFLFPRGQGRPQGLELGPDDVDALTDFLENGLYDPAFVQYDSHSVTDTFEPNVRDLTYASSLRALGAVDGLLPSYLPVGSNDALSLRDQGLEFVEAANAVSATSLGVVLRSWSAALARPTFTEKWRVTNTGLSPIGGDLLLCFDALPPGLKVVNAEGVTTRVQPRGMPYIRIRLPGGTLVPGASIDVLVQLSGTYRAGGQFHYRFVYGAGVP
jgi:cytochrome c peroxidase